MTTGAPLYLVSACASAEEFVAAFRRYADRSGLFVPIADPLPQGRRGRVALALKDGRIVLEGEVEIAVSNTRPSPLYGRVGMTLKFVDPDAPTKTTLGELEKARLAMKPPPLSIPPRAGNVPAEPRATVPPTGGRIDAANALAECVAIGDLATWKDAAAAKGDSAKFVIPTIPQMGAPRPKTPSVPPALQPKLPVEAKPPPTPQITMPTKIQSTTKEQKATTMGMPAIDRLPAVDAKSTEPELPVIAKSMTKQGIEPPRPTTMGMPPVLRAPVAALREPTPVPRRDPTPLPRRGDSIQIPKREGPVIGKQTTLGMPIVRLPADTLESPAPPPPTATGAATTPRRAHTPSTPPAPRHPTPYAPLPIVRMPALAQPLDEATERTGIPEAPPIGGDQRKTSLGIQMMTASPVAAWEDPEENKPTEQQDAVEAPAPEAPASRSGGLRASEIMAAIQGEDWTMTPDASSPTVLPKDEPEKDLDTKAAEEKSGPLPGDWAISLDPAAPGGWSAPAKVEKPPELKAPPPSGNRNIAVASAKAIEAVEWAEKPTGIGEALVEIDPSLMTPARPPADDEEPVNIVSTPLVDVPPPATTPPPFNGGMLPFAATMPQAPALPPPPLAVSYPTPPPIPPSMFPPATPLPPAPVPNASASYPAIPFVVDPTDSIQTKRKRTIILAIAAAVAVALTVVVILWTSGSKKKPADPIATTGSGSGIHVAIPEGSGSAQVVEPPPAPPPAVVDAGVAAPQLCDVDVTTNPAGAELTIDSVVVGTSPTTVHLPCGVETKISAKKARFGSATRSITASETAKKLAIKIAAPMFQLKVTSVPSGATITVGGRVVGITPTAVKVAAFSSTTITVTKDGYTTDTEKIAPRANNATHHVVLKKSVKQKLR